MKKLNEMEMIEALKEEIIDFNDDNFAYENYDETLKMYMKEIGEIPLLTLKEEKELFEVVQEGKKCHFIKYEKDKNIEFDYLKFFIILENIEYNEQNFNMIVYFFEQIKQPKIKNILNNYLNLVTKKQNFLTKEDIKNYFHENIDNINIKLSLKEVLDNIKLYINYSNAKERIIEANQRLIISNAKKLSFPFISILDLIQEGNIGLTIAIDRFDQEKTNKFSTFATPWIRRYIIEYINTNSNGAIPLTRSFFNYYRKIIKMRNELKENDITTPDNELIKIIAQELKMHESTVSEYLNFPRMPYSLDKKVNDDDDKDETIFSDFIADNKNNVEDIFEKDYLFQLIEELFEYLSDDEKNVICLRYGLGTKNNKIYTLKESEQILGITYEAVRKKEKKAILKLQKMIYKNPQLEVLKDYIK